MKYLELLPRTLKGPVYFGLAWWTLIKLNVHVDMTLKIKGFDLVLYKRSKGRRDDIFFLKLGRNPSVVSVAFVSMKYSPGTWKITGASARNS